MTSERDELLIQRYLDGDLSDEERLTLERRIKSEAELAKLLGWYKSLESSMVEIGDPDPPEDLWRRRILPALEGHLGGADSLWARIERILSRLRATMLKPAAVAAVFIVVILATTMFIRESVIETPEDKAEVAMERIAGLREEMKTELSRLTAEMEERKEYLNPELRAVYERTLAQIDESIEEAERFYRYFPEDPDAIEFLFAAYDRKVQFIERFRELEL